MNFYRNPNSFRLSNLQENISKNHLKNLYNKKIGAPMASHTAWHTAVWNGVWLPGDPYNWNSFWKSCTSWYTCIWLHSCPLDMSNGFTNPEVGTYAHVYVLAHVFAFVAPRSTSKNNPHTSLCFHFLKFFSLTLIA